MTWVKLDENMPQHPKEVAAGALGYALDTAGLCYSNRYGTDGFVPSNALGGLLPPDEDIVFDPKAIAARLIRVGRWTWDDERGGYIIHDFHDFQPTALEANGLREKRVIAGRKGGQASRRSKREANSEANAQASASEFAQANAQAKPQANGKQNRSPYPNPLLKNSRESLHTTGHPQPPVDKDCRFIPGSGVLGKAEPDPPSGPFLDGGANADRARQIRRGRPSEGAG